MKKKLVKMCVRLGFDAQPMLDVVSYEDELSPNGKPYESSTGVRNDKTEVGFGQVWFCSSCSAEEPYWDSYVILDASEATDDRIAEAATKLYETSIAQFASDLSYMLGLAKDMKAPDKEEIIKAYKDKTSIGRVSNGKYIIPVADFRTLITAKAAEEGRALASANGNDVSKWDEYFAGKFTPDIFSKYLHCLPILKLTGDGIEFQSETLYNNAVEVLSKKVASDVFMMFAESQKK